MLFRSNGTVMGSVVVAEIVMLNIEEQALVTCTGTVPIWLRSVDDTAVHKDEIEYFQESLPGRTGTYSLPGLSTKN